VDYSSTFHPTTDFFETSRFGASENQSLSVLKSLLRLMSTIEQADHHYSVHQSLERMRKLFGAQQVTFCWVENNPATGSPEALRAHSSSGDYLYEASTLASLPAVRGHFQKRSEPTTGNALNLQSALPNGVNSALFVPARATGDVVVGGLIILSEKPGYFEANPTFCRLACSTMAGVLSEWSLKTVKNRRVPEGGLTEAERELLRWEAAGQKTKQMIRVTGESVAAVDHKWSKLNKRLGVKGRAAALRVAQVLNLMD
jgi:DNA-binding CsgD family transcriptional regulator